MSKVEIRPIDAQGRVILPKSWREKQTNRSVVIVTEDDHLEIRSIDADLSRFADAIPVDIEDFEDYHALRRTLRKNAVR